MNELTIESVRLLMSALSKSLESQIIAFENETGLVVTSLELLSRSYIMENTLRHPVVVHLEPI